MIDSLLNSTVLSATVTVIGSVAVTLFAANRGKKHNKKKKVTSADSYLFANYERQIKQMHEEMVRLYDVADDREKLIEALRLKEAHLYELIEEKNKEISRLRHMREFAGEHLKLSRSDDGIIVTDTSKEEPSSE